MLSTNNFVERVELQVHWWRSTVVAENDCFPCWKSVKLSSKRYFDDGDELVDHKFPKQF